MFAIVASRFPQSNMAAAVAYDKVFVALEGLEKECNFAERRKAAKIKRELLELTRAVLKKYTVSEERKTEYFIAHPSRMLEREMRHWSTTAVRRTISATKRKCMIQFTNAEDVERVLEHGKIKPLHKVFKNKDYGVLNCKKDRSFNISYSFTREVLNFSFFYGVYNEFGIPKHI